MSPGHAIAALRCDLPNEFMPLIDMIEALQPTAEEEAILSAWEDIPACVADMETLADAVERIGGIAEACAVLKHAAASDLPSSAADVARALELMERLEQAGVTTNEELDTLLDAARGIP
jgi:hypothetical protein